MKTCREEDSRQAETMGIIKIIEQVIFERRLSREDPKKLEAIITRQSNSSR